MNFIEIRRLPPPGSLLPVFADAASEHEMGHGFGLGHTCDPDMPNTVSDDSNIMQTTGENCCCESADAYHPGKDEWAHDTADYFPTICVDCDADSGLSAAGRATCGDDAGDWDDPECGPMFSVGDRNEPFTDSLDGYWSFDADDQVTTILTEAENMCACRCEEAVDDENKRIAVSNELPCHGGEGRFALLPLDWSDQNANGQGFSTLVPVMVSGGHLGRLSWITSATLVSAGSASRLAIPTVAHGWSFMGSDPDALNVTGLRVVDNAHPTLTIPVGEVGGAYLWGADGVDPLSEGFVPPVVDLHWVCNVPDYQASDVLWVRRPGGPYALKASLIGGAWNQDFLLRPDFDHNRLWVELRGFSRFSETIPISPNEDGSWSFSYSDSGFAIAGWLRSSGDPVGSSLQFHVNSVSYGSWSTGNLNLPPLPRLP